MNKIYQMIFKFLIKIWIILICFGGFSSVFAQKASPENAASITFDWNRSSKNPPYAFEYYKVQINPEFVYSHYTTTGLAKRCANLRVDPHSLFKQYWLDIVTGFCDITMHFNKVINYNISLVSIPANIGTFDRPFFFVTTENHRQAFNIVHITPGYKIANINGCGANYGAVTSFTTPIITGSCTITANFELILYTVNINNANQNNGSYSPVNQNVLPGQNLEINTQPNLGYKTIIASGTTCLASVDSNHIIQVSNVTANCTVNIGFELKKYAVRINNQNPTNGSFTPATEIVNVDHGKDYLITTNPQNGYKTTNVHISNAESCSAALNETNNQIQIRNVVADNCLVNFGFALKTYPVGINNITPNNGTFEAPLNINSVEHGSILTIKTTPKTGYKLKDSINAVNCNAVINSENSNEIRVSNIINQNCIVNIEFEIKKYSVDIRNLNPNFGSFTPITETINHGADLTITTRPEVGYKPIATVINSASCSALVNENNNTILISNVNNADCRVDIGFQLKTYLVRITTDDNLIGGSYTPISEEASKVNHGNSLTITTNPNNGYQTSVQSSGQCRAILTPNTTNSIQINNVESADCVVKIGFTIVKYQINILNRNPDDGKFSANPSNLVVDHNKSLEISLTPRTNYRAVIVNNENCDNINYNETTNKIILSNVVKTCFLEINFVIRQYNVTITNDPVNSGNGTYNPPASIVTVNHGSNLIINGTPNHNHRPEVSGNCQVILDGNNIEITNIVQDCSIAVGFKPITDYLISMIGSNNGTITSPSGHFHTVNNAGSLSITAQADADYFSQVDVLQTTCSHNNNNGNNFEITNVDKNCSIVIGFISDRRYSVTVNANEENGRVLFWDDLNNIDHNENLFIFALPNNGYELDTSLVNGSNCSIHSDIVMDGENINLNNIRNNCTINISFREINYSIGITENSINGSFIGSNNLTAVHGSDLTIQTNPNEGFVPVVSNENFCDIYSYIENNTIYLINIKSNCNITIDFTPNQYWVDIQNLAGSGSGTYSHSGLQFPMHAEDLIITAAPAINSSPIISGDCNPNQNGNEIRLINIQKSCTIQLGFEIKRYLIDIQNNNATHGGYVEPASLWVNHGGNLSIPVTPNEGYHSINPIGNNCNAVLNSNTNVIDITNITANCSISIGFEINQYSVEIQNGINSNKGIYSPAGSENNVNHGNGFQITTEPNLGWHAVFTQTGNCRASLNENTIQVNQVTASNCVITVGFEINRYSVMIQNGNGFDKGSYSLPEASNLMFDYDSSLSISTTPNQGYHPVVSGSCNPTLNETTHTITVNNIRSNCTVIIGFDINQYSITIENGEGSNHGSFSPSVGSNNLNDGESFLIETTPNENYRPAVSSNCHFILDAQFIQINEINVNCSISIGFVPDDTYLINILNGKGSNHGSYSAPSNLNIKRGENLSIETTPENGYRPNITGTCNISLNGNKIQATNVIKNCSIIIGFVSNNSYSVSIQKGSNSMNGSYVTPDNLNVPLNGTLLIETKPNEHYHPIASGTCRSRVDGTHIIVFDVTSNCSLIIDFEINKYTVVLQGTNQSNEGSYDLPSHLEIVYGGNLVISTRPKFGYHPVFKGTCPHSIENITTIIIQNVTFDCTIEIVFEINEYKLEIGLEPQNAGRVELYRENEFRLLRSKSDLISGDEEATGLDNVPHDSELEFLITPNLGYKVSDVTSIFCDGGSFNPKTNIFTVTATDHCTIFAIFVLDDNNNNNNNHNNSSTKAIPVLNQWGIISLVLLMMLMIIYKPLHSYKMRTNKNKNNNKKNH